MTTYTVQAAKTHLSSILHDVEAGEQVVIARGSVAVARIVPLGDAPRRHFGPMQFTVPDDFDAPLPDDETAAWE